MAATRTSLRFVVGTALFTLAADGCSKSRVQPEPGKRPEVTPEMWREMHDPPRTNMYYSDEAVRRAQTGEAQTGEAPAGEASGDTEPVDAQPGGDPPKDEPRPNAAGPDPT